jgi:hypothetical protein
MLGEFKEAEDSLEQLGNTWERRWHLNLVLEDRWDLRRQKMGFGQCDKDLWGPFH